MKTEKAIYSLIQSDSPYEAVELADGPKRFTKQLVKFGNWADPHDRKNGKMKLDKSWGDKIVENFKKKIVGRVPVPYGHPQTAADLAQLNCGELVGLECRDDGLYGVLEVRDAQAAEKIANDQIWDVSISFDNHYIDTKHGKDVGPTLFHVGLLTDPYLKGMAPFKALANGMKAIMLSESEETIMSLVKLTNSRDFAVTVNFQDGEEEKTATVEPGDEVEVPEDQEEAVAKQLADAEAPETSAEEEPAEETPAEEVPAEEEVDEKAQLEKELADARREIATRDAKDKFRKLLEDGKVVPAQESTFLSLYAAAPSTVSLADGSTKSSTDMLTELLEAGPKRIKFGEEGVEVDEKAEKAPYDELSDREKEELEKFGTTPDDYNEAHDYKVSKE